MVCRPSLKLIEFANTERRGNFVTPKLRGDSRIYDRLRYWLGAEPFLGIFVLAFAVPFAALLAYVAVYGVIEHPWTVVAYAIIWCIPALLTYLATRTSERAGKILMRASRITLGVGIAIWFVWDDFVPWRGFNSTMIFSLFVSAVFIVWLVRTSEREDQIASLPDYRERLD